MRRLLATIAVGLVLVGAATACAKHPHAPITGDTTLEVDGTLVRAIVRRPSDDPSPRTVLFLHGQSYTATIWADGGILDDVVRAGWRAVAIDLPADDEGAGPEIIGEGWTTVAKLNTGAPAPKTDEAPKEVQGFLDALGDKVSGKFGSGTVFKTKIVNVLMTDSGTVYVGAVTPDKLVAVADSAK